VFSSELSAADQKSHTVFDTQKSSTFQNMQGATFKISYGDGSSASGNVGTDVVNIGGASVQTQAVELATQVSGSFLDETASNGLVGLAFSKLNTVSPTPQKTFFDNIGSQLDEPVMTVSLKSDSNKGAYEFGTIDSTKYTGQIANISVDPTNGFWQFTSTSFKVGDNGDTKQMTTTTSAIADTGTSLMLVSPEAAQGYYDQVEGSVNSEEVGGYMFPCNAQLPTFTVAVGKSTATIPSNVINFAQVGTDMSGTECEFYLHVSFSFNFLSSLDTNPYTDCYGGIQSSQDSQFMIFGDVFLKTMFVVFDQRGPSLGLATSA
jgi:aspergillopepsin I